MVTLPKHRITTPPGATHNDGGAVKKDSLTPFDQLSQNRQNDAVLGQRGNSAARNPRTDRAMKTLYMPRLHAGVRVIPVYPKAV